MTKDQQDVKYSLEIPYKSLINNGRKTWLLSIKLQIVNWLNADLIVAHHMTAFLVIIVISHNNCELCPTLVIMIQSSTFVCTCTSQSYGVMRESCAFECKE